jgi:hypothetical protein
MADPERARLLLLGMAAWSELEATVGSVVAQTLRDDGAAVEAARQKAHDILDQHIDLKIQGVAAIRRDIEKQSRET